MIEKKPAAFDPAELELLIRGKGDEAMRLAVARDSIGARRCYVELAALIAQRSEETVHRMECERGLR